MPRPQLACQTRQKPGPFQVAGAHTIATLWTINDEATRRIMEEFYRNYLVKKQPPLEALRNAQLWAHNNPDLFPRGVDPPVGESTRLSPNSGPPTPSPATGASPR